jgi:hypothetical protein
VAASHCVVVDTNVLAVADGMHEGASPECVLACVQLARRVSDGQRLGVDSGDEILNEYLGTLRNGRTAGIGAKLAESLWRRRFDARVCHQIAISSIADPPGSYAEVPVPLRDFDVDDQKFLAVALSEGGVPLVFQALDEEWWRRRADLIGNGIAVQFLCAVDLLSP